MTNFVNYHDKKFRQYFYNSKNPQKFILYCAVINRLLSYINNDNFGNLESFVKKNSTKDLFLINSKSEYIIRNFETENCIFTDKDYIYVLNYMKNIIVFEEDVSEISKEINDKFQKIMLNNYNLINKSNGGIFYE